MCAAQKEDGCKLRSKTLEAVSKVVLSALPDELSVMPSAAEASFSSNNRISPLHAYGASVEMTQHEDF